MFSGKGYLVNSNVAGNINIFNSISNRAAWRVIKLCKR